MKIDKIKTELAQMSIVELKEKIDAIRRELFSLKLNAPTAHIKDYSSFKKLRKHIARSLTALRQKQQ